MARYHVKKIGGSILKKMTLGDRVLLSGDQWVLEAFRAAWVQQKRKKSPSARGVRIHDALPKVQGIRGFADLAAFRQARRGGKKLLDPGAYFLFGSFEELLTRSSELSFGLYREGGRVRGVLRFPKVVERMDKETKAFLGVRAVPGLGGEPPKTCALSMSFDRKVPEFLAAFETFFPKAFHQGLQSFYQQLELFFRGEKAETLLGYLKGPFRLMEFPPTDDAPSLRLGGKKVQLLGFSFEGSWVDPKTRKKLAPALQVFALGANQQRKNRGKRRFLLHQEGNAQRGMLRGSIKTPLQKRAKNIEDLFNPRLAWEGQRIAIGFGGMRIWDALEQFPKGKEFHEFYTFDGGKCWEIVERLGSVPLTLLTVQSRFPPTTLEPLVGKGKEMFSSMGMMSLGLLWEERDGVLFFDWQPSELKRGAR
jgi:hypothetical protein